MDGVRALLDAAGEGAGTPAQAVALVAQLGGSALAMRLAGAYLAQATQAATEVTTVPAYQAELHLRGLSGGEALKEVMGRVCELSLDFLDEQGLGQARTLLRLLSCLPDAPIPYRLLLRPELMAESELFWGLTRQRLEDLVDGLRRLSLIDTTASNGEPAVLSLDPLIREAAHADLDRSGQRPECCALWATLMFLGTAQGTAGLPEDPAELPIWRLLTPFAFHVFANLLDQHQDQEHVDRAANAALHAADHLASIGRYAEARDEATAVFRGCRRVLGAEHHRTLLGQAFAASWTGRAGDPVAARDMYADVLSVRVQVSGVDHPDSIVAHSNLAFWTGEAGDAAGARDGYATLVPIHERVNGAGHPFTLFARCRLAYWTGMAGDAAAARDICAELLPLAVQVWGNDDPETGSVRSDLAHWTQVSEAHL